MNWHRLLCGLGHHHFAKLEARRRGCLVCLQQQRYIEDANTGLNAFWCDIPPVGRIVEPKSDDAVGQIPENPS